MTTDTEQHIFHGEIIPPARSGHVVRDWLMHANGNRRRAFEYKRWALEYLAQGNLARFYHYRAQSDRSWGLAKNAVQNARIAQEVGRG